MLDNGFVGTDADGSLVARTASPPDNGVTGSGDIVCVKTTRNAQTGAVTVKGAGIDVFALLLNQVATFTASNLGGGLTAAGAAGDRIGAFAGSSEIYAINMNFGGVYQLLPMQKALSNGELTLSIEAAAAPGSESNPGDSSPRVTRVETLPSGKLKLTVDHLQVPATATATFEQATALCVWISPNRSTSTATVAPLRCTERRRASASRWHAPVASCSTCSRFHQRREHDARTRHPGAGRHRPARHQQYVTASRC